MQTTEIFVEQLIIGVLASLAVALFIPAAELRLIAEQGVAVTAVLLGAAYLVGILADRIADTLLEDVEQHHRLLTAVERTFPDAPATDPFPVDRLRLAVDRDQQLAPYGSYLRSRIRLMRSLTVALPALTVGWAVRSLEHDALGASVLAAFVAVAYGGLFLLTLLRPVDLPRTDDLTDATRWGDYLKRVGADRPGSSRSTRTMRALFGSRSLVTVLLLLSAASGLLLARQGAAAAAIIPLAGLGATALAGWVWWRITRTFHAFLLGVAGGSS